MNGVVCAYEYVEFCIDERAGEDAKTEEQMRIG